MSQLTLNPCVILPLFFALFMATLHPTMAVGDSGELVSAASFLGIPHPPGYPLFVLIAKLFTLILPFGSIAYRVNLIAAIFGMLSCGLVYLLVLKIADKWEGAFTAPRIGASASAIALSFSFEFWYRSTVAETYTLNTFLFLLVLYILFLWKDGLDNAAAPGNLRLLYLGSFLLGLGMGNHHTITTVMPGAILYILWAAFKGPKISSIPRLAYCLPQIIFFFMFGISIYIFLPIRSHQNPFIDWGNPESLRNFVDVFTRREYLPEAGVRSWETFLKQLNAFSPVREFTLIGLLFGLLGVVTLVSRKKREAVLLVTAFLSVSYGLILMAGSSSTGIDLMKKFFLPAYALFSIFIGVGVAVASSLGKVPAVLTSILAAGLLVFQFANHYPLNSNSDNYLAYDYGMNELDSLKEGAVYISKGEVKTFPLWYLQGVERYREDAEVITAYFLTQNWYTRKTIELVGAVHESPPGLTYKQMLVNAIFERNKEKGVYAGFLDEEYLPNRLYAYSQGVTFYLYTSDDGKPTGDVWEKYRLRSVRRVDWARNEGSREILKDYASSRYNTGIEYYNAGDRDRAMKEFEAAVSIDPDEPDSLFNLAVVYSERGIKLREAEAMALKAIELFEAEEDRELAAETLSEIRHKLGSKI